ncbi:MAG TPA: DUF434 domain-containing protein [Sediminispirochaeta sp.]|nr:DUF434 domain-containing protein [Sediminispirochaeta sp.]
MRDSLQSPQFEAAVRDYLLLLNRGYPEKRSRDLVADRYQLDKYQRSVLFRGVFSTKTNTARGRKRIDLPLDNSLPVSIDFLNLLLLLMNYLYGRHVYISTDGFARDDGENFTSFDNAHIFHGALGLLRESLPGMGFNGIRWFIDSKPTSKLPPWIVDSHLLQREITVENSEFIYREKIDRELIKVREGLIATADSVILDKTGQNTVDIGGYILRRRIQEGLLDISVVARRFS